MLGEPQEVELTSKLLIEWLADFAANQATSKLDRRAHMYTKLRTGEKQERGRKLYIE